MSYQDENDQATFGAPGDGTGSDGSPDSNGSGSLEDPAMAGALNGSFGEEPTEFGGDFVAEDKKPLLSRTTLLMSGVIALGAAGVWFMYQRSGGPSKAAAVSTETVQAQKTINAFLDGGGASLRTMESMLRNTERVVQQFLAYPSMTQVPLSDLRTNPFRQRSASTPDAPVNDLAEKRKREEERLAMLKNVQALQLQSILYSDSRKACLINDAMYREGQQIDAFTVEKITPSSVIVKGGAYRFELRMQR